MSSQSPTKMSQSPPKASCSFDRIVMGARFRRWSQRRHTWAAADAVTWFAAVWIAALVRRLYVAAPLGLPWLAATSMLAAGVFVGCATWRGLYGRGRVRGSYDEIIRLVQASALTGLVLVGVAVLPVRPGAIAGTIPVLATMVALAGALSLRVLARVVRARAGAALAPAADQIPTIMLGAGSAGRALIEQLRTDRDSHCQPIALLDDDPAKLGARVGGMTVLGDRSKLAELTWRYEARQLIVCVANADAATLREIRRQAGGLGLDMLVLPSQTERLGRPLTVADVRSVSLEDLIGRTHLPTDDDALRALLSGKSVLVTGAGGSLGAEITQRVAHLGASPITMLDIDQPALHTVQIDVQRLGKPLPEAVIADIRELHQVREAFEISQPTVVIHAAAIHDAPKLQASPEEAWRSNVIGTANVVESARAHNVALFVNVSSFAAEDPQTTLGASELLAERLTRSVATDAAGTFLSVRLPELVGSRHGALTALTEQLRRGLRVPSGDESPTSFLRVADAAQLVLDAMVHANSGRTYTISSDETTDLEDVAQALAWAGLPRDHSRSGAHRSAEAGAYAESTQP